MKHEKHEWLLLSALCIDVWYHSTNLVHKYTFSKKVLINGPILTTKTSVSITSVASTETLLQNHCNIHNRFIVNSASVLGIRMKEEMRVPPRDATLMMNGSQLLSHVDTNISFSLS